MKTLIVPDSELERMLKQWLAKQGGPPEFRVPQCWNCGRQMYGQMWHVFFRGGEREAHLCIDCGRQYEVSAQPPVQSGATETGSAGTPDVSKV